MVSATEPLTFTTLYDRYAAALEHYIARLVQSPETAQDLAQEVWIKVFEHLDETMARGDFHAQSWLYRMARNRATDYIRRGRSRKAGGRVQWEPLDGPREGEALVFLAQTFDPESRALTLEYHQRVRSLVGLGLEGLRHADRRLLWLHYQQQLTTAQVATTLTCSVPAAKAALHRARQAFSVVLAAERAERRRPRQTTMPSRLWSKIDQTGGPDACWPWLGAVTNRTADDQAGPTPLVTAGHAPRWTTPPARRVLLASLGQPVAPWAITQVASPTCHPSCMNPAHLAVVTGAPARRQGTPIPPIPPATAIPSGAVLRQRRRLLGVSLRVVAARAGLHHGTVFQVEHERDMRGVPLGPAARLEVRHQMAVALTTLEAEAAPALHAGALLAQRRRSLGLTIQGLASLVPCNQATVFRLEHNGAPLPGSRREATLARHRATLERLEAARAAQAQGAGHG